MLLNKFNVPYITPSELTWLSDWNIGEIYNFDNGDYYAIQFLDPAWCSVELLQEAIPPDILYRIQNKQLILVLGNQLESFHSTVDFTYEILINLFKIPEEQILLLTSSPNIVDAIDIVSKKYTRKPIKAIWCRIYEYTMAMHETFVSPSKFEDKSKKKFDKKFICLNRRWRPHRAAIVALLECKNLINQGYVSLGECEGGNWKDMYPWLLEINKDKEFQELFHFNREKILNIPYLHVDTPILEHNIPEFRNTLTQFYEDTYFSIVTETSFYSKILGNAFDDGIMISEKTCKAISQRHPFFLLNRPHALRALRSVGYQTFEPYINESYDNEIDDGARLLKIINEVERLCHLSDSDIIEFIKNTQKICEHNYRNMVDYMKLNFNNKKFKLYFKYSTRLQ